MITSILSLMLAQVGPNPSLAEPITPPEVADSPYLTVVPDDDEQDD